MKTRTLGLVFALAAGLSTALMAERADEKEVVSQKEYRVLVFDRHDGDMELVITEEKVAADTSGSKASEAPEPGKVIRLHRNNFSDAFKTKSKALFFYRKGEVKAGKEVAQLSLVGDQADKFVLLLVPLPDSEKADAGKHPGGSRVIKTQAVKQYAIAKVKDDKSFDKGQRLIVNLTSYDIGGKLEDQTFKVEGGK